MYLIVGLSSFVLGAFVMLFIIKGPVPFFDNGFRIYAAKDKNARNAIVNVLAHFGLQPRFQMDSQDIKRALMADNITVINATSPKNWEAMGKPAAGLALTVQDPKAAANKAVEMLAEAGYTAENLGEMDSDVPAGAMTFVKTNALEGTILVFRKHFFKMGPKPPKWKTS